MDLVELAIQSLYLVIEFLKLLNVVEKLLPGVSFLYRIGNNTSELRLQLNKSTDDKGLGPIRYL
ncbi:MAG: hypothetical protein ACR2IV_07460 [Bryobacteraceae bacterium]